jgi:hypothetical protein
MERLAEPEPGPGIGEEGSQTGEKAMRNTLVLR